MSYQVINTANDLLVYDVANDNVNYYDKSKLTVSVSRGLVRLLFNNDTEGFQNVFSTRYTDVTAPSSTSAYDLATQIYGYINSSGGSLNSAQIVLTSGQILALNSTPITLVTGITGVEIQVVSAAMHLKWNSVAYATNTTLAIGTTSDPDGQAQLNCLAATSEIMGTFGLVTTGTSANMHTGENLVVSVASGNPVNGNSQVVIDVMYRITDMP